MDNRWWSYVTRVIAPDVPATAARKAGVTPATLTRWKQGTAPDARHVVAVAKAYGVSPLEALVAAGVLTSDDLADAGSCVVPLSEWPLDELIDEVELRLREVKTRVGELSTD